MKRIVLSLAVVVAAFCAHAAAVSWQVSSIKDSAGNLIKATTDKYTAVVTLWSGDGSTVIGTSPIT